MELSIKTITLAVLLVIVLSVLSIFLSSQSASQIQSGDATRIFNTYCQSYKAADCSWDVTKQESFNEFLDACRSIYGQESEAYSCLYISCTPCSKGDINRESGLECASLCEQCRGNSALDIRSSCCQQFALTCSSSNVNCRDTCK